MRRARLVGPLWRWHRRAGLLASLVLLALALTGLLLNHADALGLDRRTVAWDWMYTWYGAPAHPQLGFAAGRQWITQSAAGELFVDERAAGRCDGSLRGALVQQELVVVACERELLLLAADGARVDAVGAAAGLPVPLQAAGSDATGALLLQVGGSWRRFDLERMSAGEAAEPVTVAQAGPLPATLGQALRLADRWLSWERVLLDLHSGRLFGRFGMLVVDIVGALSVLLALSGIAIWSLRRRRLRAP